ncbi:MAG: hypothetical protein ABW004_00275 [Aeromicrobium sp.]
MDTPRASAAPAIAVGLHHRVRKFSPSGLEPGVLALDRGRLSFRTASGSLFDTDASRATGVLTTFGTLVVTADGTSHAFVSLPYAGNAAPGFTDEQVRTLRAIDPDTLPGLGRRTLSRWRVVGEQRRAFGRMVAWSDALTLRGVRVQVRTRRFARSQLVIAAWALPTLVAAGVVLLALGVGSHDAGS